MTDRVKASGNEAGDIVERLRFRRLDGHLIHETMTEAAAEIERLRADYANLDARLGAQLDEGSRRADEIDRLRGALAAGAKTLEAREKQIAQNNADWAALRAELNSANARAFGGEVSSARLGALVDELRAALTEAERERDEAKRNSEGLWDQLADTEREREALRELAREWIATSHNRSCDAVVHYRAQCTCHVERDALLAKLEPPK